MGRPRDLDVVNINDEQHLKAWVEKAGRPVGNGDKATCDAVRIAMLLPVRTRVRVPVQGTQKLDDRPVIFARSIGVKPFLGLELGRKLDVGFRPS